MTAPSDALSVADAARDAPDRPALVGGGRTLTYAELAGRVASVVAGLDARGLLGFAPVAFTPRVDVESVVRILALVEAGVPFVPLHPKLGERERATLARDAAVAAVLPDDVAWPEPASRIHAHARAPISPERTLAILFTSGTTGRPKGAVLSRRAFLAAARASAERLPLGPGDRWLLCMPPAHVGGLSVIIRAVLARAAVVLGPSGEGFDAAAVAAALHRDAITHLSLVPTMLHRLLALEPRFEAPPALEAILLGGAPADAQLLEEARARRLPVRATYGLTEACSQVATATAEDWEKGVAGARPLPGVEVRVVGGEIELRGPTLFDGYLGHDRATTFRDDGFFPTGDLGALDAEGRLHLRGRRADLILSGGENVYPAEVEAALVANENVRAACVFGVSDPEWGERVAAALVLAPGLHLEDARRACAEASEALAAFKRPRLVAVLDELPTRGIGKLDRRRAAELATPSLVLVRE
jgi:O-succinylbenzoic acid--CoA ligase